MNKILWTRNGTELRATLQHWNYSNPGQIGLRDADMDPIHKWSQEHDCGRRMSFDTWRFRNDAEITMFLLAWS
jgi:hypothetical protein